MTLLQGGPDDDAQNRGYGENNREITQYKANDLICMLVTITGVKIAY